MESVSPKEEKKMYGKYHEYEIKDAARTIIEAEEIKKDEEKMKYVEKCLKKKASAAKKAVKSIADMRDRYNEMEDDEEE